MATKKDFVVSYGLQTDKDTTQGAGLNTLFVDSINNKVGIGTTSPLTNLHISDGNGAVSSALYTSDYLTISAQSTAPGFNIISSSSSSTSDRGVFKATRSRGTLASPTVPILDDNTFSLLGAIYDGSAAALATAAINMDVDGTVSSGVAPQRITFWTGNTNSRVERLRITSGGNVGIGTTNPLSKLDVRGDIRLEDSSPQVFFKETGVTNTPEWNWTADGGNFSGRLNNASPYFLNVQTTATNDAIDFIALTHTGSYPVLIGTTTKTGTASQSLQVTGGGYFSGNVGIGTTNPTSPLHVVGNSYITGNLTVDGTINALFQTNTITQLDTSVTVTDTGTNGTITFTNDGTVAATIVGNLVGIGTTNPGAKFHVEGNTLLNGNLTLQVNNNIVADFTNATLTTRTYFITSTANSSTTVGAIPNGTGSGSAFYAFNNQTPTNAPYVGVTIDASNAYLRSYAAGTGSALPLTIETQNRTSANSAAITINTGTTTTSGTTGAVTIKSGNSVATSGNLDISTGTGTTSGNITIDVGNGSTTDGTITIGGTNAASVTLPSGRTKIGNTTLTQGGSVTITLPTLTGTLYATGNTDVALTDGGTNASLTAVNGGVVYSTASAMAITAAGTSGQFLRSAGAAAPVWTTLTMEDIPGASYKASVLAATTGALTINTAQTTIDGITISASSRILVKNQTTASQNGIYTNLTTTSWTRAADADTSAEIASAIVNIDQGTTQGGTLWTNTFKSTDTLGTTAMNWREILYNNYSGPTFAGTLNAATIQTSGNIELGNASDTTLSRSAAGRLAVEGVNVVTVSSTDTLTNKTLTAPRITTASHIADSNGNELIKFPTAVANAVNEITISNVITGTALGPIIEASGSDTNVSLTLKSKGTGSVNIGLDSNSNPMIYVLDSGVSIGGTTDFLYDIIVNGSVITDSITGNDSTGTGAVTIAAAGTDNNITLTPTGTGTVNAPTFNATSTTNGGFQGIDADTVTTPSFTWSSDLTTGIYRVGAGSMGFTSVGVNKFTLGSLTSNSTHVTTTTSPNASVSSFILDYNLSGTTALTANRTQNGLFVDLDHSSTGGTTTDGQRESLYGIQVDCDTTGTPYSLIGVYAPVRSANTTGTISAIHGLRGYAEGDSGTGGTTTAVYGVTGEGRDGGAGTVSNVYGANFYVLKETAATATLPIATAMRAEVEIDANTITTTKAGEFIIDIDGGVLTNTYLTYGGYEGTVQSSYTGVTGTAPSGGTGATFTVTRNNDGVYGVTLTAGGSGYTTGNTFTIPGTAVGGATPANDITLTITCTTSPGPITSISGVTGTAISNWAWNAYYVTDIPSYFSGELRIGSTTDIGDYKLQVTGNAYVSGTLDVRTAIDLADSDILRFGSSDDWELFHDGTNNYMDLNVGNLIVRDTTTTRFTFEKTTGNFTATGRIESSRIFTAGAPTSDPGRDITIWGSDTRGIYIRNTSANLGYSLVEESTSFKIKRTYSSTSESEGLTLDGSGNLTVVGNVTAYSDINLKKDIEVIKNPIEKIKQIRGVTYSRIDLEGEDNERQTGVIAQEVEKVLPEAVSTNEEGIKSVAYGNMVGLLVEAIKEQQEQIKLLQNELNELKGV